MFGYVSEAIMDSEILSVCKGILLLIKSKIKFSLHSWARTKAVQYLVEMRDLPKIEMQGSLFNRHLLTAR